MADVSIALPVPARKTIFIYGLTDPRDGKIRYIGKTNDQAQRLRSHESEARYNKRSAKCRWIRELAALGMRPSIVCLESIEDGRWVEAEIKWIARARSERWGVFNVTDGGDDIPAAAHTEEARKKALATRIKNGRWAESVKVANQKKRGKRHTAEAKRKIGDAQRGKKLSADHVAKVVAAQKGRAIHPNTLAALHARKGSRQTEESNQKRRETLLTKRTDQSDRQKVNWKNPEYRRQVQAKMTGRKLSEITKAKLTETSKASWSNPEHRLKRTAALRTVVDSPEWRKKRSEIASKLWKNPEFRARMMLARKQAQEI